MIIRSIASIFLIPFFPLLATGICRSSTPQDDKSSESVNLHAEKHSPFRLRQIELLSNGNKDSELNLIHRKSKISYHSNTVLYQNKNFKKEGIYKESIYPTESEDKLVGAKRTTNKKNIDTRTSYGNDNKKILEGDVHEEWVQRYASNSLPSDDYSNAIAVDNIGNVYITGVSFTSNSGADYFTIKFNQRGDTLWSHRFNGSGNDYDEATAIALDRNGNVYVTGYSYGGTTGYDYVTIKYTSDGIVEWIRDYNSQDDSTDVATCLGIDSLDNVFISGYCYSRETDFDIFTIKYNSKGNIQWSQKYNGSDNNAEGTFSIFVNPDGQIFIAGYSIGEYSGLDCITLCYSPEGDLNWSDRYSSSGSGTDVATSVAGDGGGNCFTTGFSAQLSTGYDFITIKYYFTGDREWIQTYDDSVHGSDIATSIAVDQFGNVYVTGSGIATNGLSDMTTVAYNTIGYQKWVANHDGTGNYSDGGTAIAIDNNNLKIFITGYTNYRLGGYRDATTIRYNDDGTISWLMRYDGTSGGDDIPSALALDRKGNVFVTGSSEGVRSSYDFFTLKYASFETDQWPTRFNNGFGNNWLNDMVTDRWGNVYVCGTDSSHFVVVEYDSTGVKRWSTQFGSKRSNPTDLTVDDFGNVFVTGYTNGPSNNLDYATVKINPMGDIVWSVLYNGTGNLDDMASAIAVSDQGNVYITGSSYGNGSKTDYLTIKYNSQGIEQWVARYNGAYNNRDSATALVLDDEENVYVTGTCIRFGSTFDYLTIKYLDNGVQAWQAFYNGTGNRADYANAISIDQHGNIYITGRSFGDGTQLDFATIKYNSTGVLQWVTRFNGPGNNLDAPSSLSIDDNGNVCVTGTSYTSGGSTNYATVFYDSNGVLQWQQIYNGEGNGYDRANDVKFDAIGNVYVAGSSQGKNSGFDYVTIKYSPFGSQSWITKYNSLVSSDDEAKTLTVDLRGYVYVSGNSVSPSNKQDFLITKSTLAGTSDQLWPVRNDGPGVSFDVAKALVIDSHADIYIGGTSYGDETYEDYLVLKYDNDGSMQWKNSFNGSYNEDDNVASIAVDTLGNLCVTGTLYSLFYPCNYGTVKFNNNGTKLWASEYDGPQKSFDFATGVTIDNSANVVVTGYSSGDTAYDYATVKYDSEGKQLWTTRYDGTAGKDDLAYAMAVDDIGNIYVTGLSYGEGTSSDYSTIKYNSDGMQIWEARYNGPINGDDRAVAIALDRQKNVYVTGFGVGSDTTYDFTTVKYDSSGAEVYVARFSGESGSNEQAKAIAVDSSGNVFVTGSCHPTGAEDADIVTVKYDSDGDEQWNVRYNGLGDGDDKASCIYLDRLGDVYIAGKSIGSDLSYDYVTIKYSSSGELVCEARYTSTEGCNDEVQGLAVDDDLNVYVTGTSKSLDWSVITTIKYSQDITGTDELDNPRPAKYQLFQNYPNPFNPITKIKYSLAKRDHVTLKLYNLLGQEIWDLVEEVQGPGVEEITFNAASLPSGMYFYRLKAGGFVDTKKMILIR